MVRRRELCRLDINGNVEIIMYPEESDSTINKIVNAESSFLTATFRGRTTERIKLWPETTGTATPLFIARKTLYYLPKFVWHEGAANVAFRCIRYPRSYGADDGSSRTSGSICNRAETPLSCSRDPRNTY